MSETTNSARPALESALISAPMSVLRAVTTPSNGAVMRLKSASASSRSTLAWAALRQRRLGGEVAGLLVAVCLETALAAAQRLPALGGDGGQRLGWPGPWRGGPGLQELLVEVGRVDLGQQLAGLHLRADVDVPGLQVAADAGIDRRA